MAKMTHGLKTLSLEAAVGTALAHDVTEIRRDAFKGRAFRKGHIVQAEDLSHLRRLGKERLYVLEIGDDALHEDAAAQALARALAGDGVEAAGEPREGKVNLLAARDGLLIVRRDALLAFNMLGEVMCAALHSYTVVRKGQIVAGTRAIPLVVKKRLVEEAEVAAQGGVLSVKPMRKPRAGVVITGNEVAAGRVEDGFAPIIRQKIAEVGGEVVATCVVADDDRRIEDHLRRLLDLGADLLITTGGMSVDPDDVTRFAIRRLGARDITYGSAVLPGAMVLVGYLDRPGRTVPIIGVPACGMYHKRTVFDLILPRVLAGERITRKEVAELGHGGLCLGCQECRYPVCPFGAVG